MVEKIKKWSVRHKVALAIIILVILFITYQFIKITTLEEIITDEQVQKLDALHITVDFIWQKKAFFVDQEASIESILDILSDLTIWPTYLPIDEFNPELKNGYHVRFQYEKNANLPYFDLYIYDKHSLNMNGKYYKILGDSNLEKIYNIIILAQPENSLGQYYYDLMDSN